MHPQTELILCEIPLPNELASATDQLKTILGTYVGLFWMNAGVIHGRGHDDGREPHVRGHDDGGREPHGRAVRANVPRGDVHALPRIPH